MTERRLKILFHAEAEPIARYGPVERRPVHVEMSFVVHGTQPVLYGLSVVDVVEKRVEAQANELATMRERVSRIAMRLEGVTAELRLLTEEMTPEESAQVLARIEKNLGIQGG